MHSKQTNFTFEDTLTQIGLGYTFLFLISYLPHKGQLVSLILLLTGYWLAFALYPLPGANFDYNAAGVLRDWEHNLSGFAAHWNKNTNFARAFDRWFLNLFPRESAFTNNGGGYSTLSFIPTLGTMILGLFAGKILKADYSYPEKIKKFLLIGLILLTTGIVLHLAGINPIVKRIWTPSWVLFSGGICFWFLAFFYLLADYRKKKNLFFIFTVIGSNSIAAYVIADGLSPFITNSLYIHLGASFDKTFGEAYASIIKGLAVLTIEFAILWWMFRKKLFIKI
jgi:predicted acyltransferase